MKPIFNFLASLTLLFLGMQQQAIAQSESQLFSAILDFQPNGEVSVLKVYCKNHTTAPFLLSYELEVQQQKEKDLVQQNEGGEFDIKSRQNYLLALHTYDYKPNHRMSVKLKIFSAGELIAADSLLLLPRKNKPSPEIINLTNEIIKKKKEATVEELIANATKTESPKVAPKPKKQKPAPQASTPPAKQNNAVTNSPAPVKPAPPARPQNKPTPQKTGDRIVLAREEIGIDGLIIDETRSKMAHDFYDLFYRKWISPQGASDYIIYIRELPSRGRIARVSLAVNDDVVLQRNLSPRFDLLEQQVNLAIRVLTKHLQKKESVKDQLGNEDAMGSGIF